MLKITQKYYRSVIGFFFIFVISVSMLFFGMDLGGPPQDSYAIRVNDTDVPYSEVYQRRREYQEQLRQAFGPNYLQFAGEHLREMNQRVVDNLVSEVVLLQFASQMGLTAGARQVQRAIQEMFEGQFSLALYDAFLQQRGFSARQFESRMQQEIVRMQLQGLIFDASLASEREALQMREAMLTRYTLEYLEINPELLKDQVTEIDQEALRAFFERNAIRYERPDLISYVYVSISPEDFMDLVEVTEQDIELHYTDNMNRYRTPDEVLVRQIKLEISDPQDPATRAGVRAFAEELIGRIEGGEDIGELAARYSDDAESKEMAGQVGWIKRGDRPQQYERAVFARTDGGLAPIIESDDGIYIASVEDYRPVAHRDLSEVRDQIEEEIRKREAPAYTAVMAADLYEKWLDSGKSLEDFAGSVSLVANESSGFLEQREDPEGMRGLTRRVMEAPELDRQLVDLRFASVLVSVTEYQERDIPDLERVRELVEADYRAEKASELARSIAQQSLEAFRSGERGSLSEVASEHDFLEVVELSGLSRRSPGQLLSRSSILADDVFGATSPHTLTDRFYQVEDTLYLVGVKAIEAPQEEELTRDFDQFREEASARLASNMFMSLVERRKKESTIQINQSVYVD